MMERTVLFYDFHRQYRMPCSQNVLRLGQNRSLWPTGPYKRARTLILSTSLNLSQLCTADSAFESAFHLLRAGWFPESKRNQKTLASSTDGCLFHRRCPIAICLHF